VHGFWSSQAIGVPDWQIPWALQISCPLQIVPSSHCKSVVHWQSSGQDIKFSLPLQLPSPHMQVIEFMSGASWAKLTLETMTTRMSMTTVSEAKLALTVEKIFFCQLFGLPFLFVSI
jgi:hypothetical protein